MDKEMLIEKHRDTGEMFISLWPEYMIDDVVSYSDNMEGEAYARVVGYEMSFNGAKKEFSYKLSSGGMVSGEMINYKLERIKDANKKQ